MRDVVKLEPGQTISGTLRLVKPLAEGGMGSVWIAHHLVLGRDVAVKSMAKQWAAMPTARTRFLREAKITAQLESPHVVRVLDCRLDEADEPYLVLELLHGENLEQRLRHKGPLSIYEVEEIVEQTASALGEAHAAGIVHRDVKPENVFLVESKSTFVKILDFGVARPKANEDCLDVDLLPAGTPQYMSPEHMFDPETTDERSDLFSLAAVAYFALTGRSPFEAESLEAMYFAIEGASFARPSELRPELPEAVDAWFERALARDRDVRFQNAREMADALHAAVRAASSARIEVPPPQEEEEDIAPITKSVPGLPRRRSGVGRSFVVVTAAAAAVAIWVWRSAGDVTPAVASTVDAQDGGLEAAAHVAPASVYTANAPAPAKTGASAARTKRAAPKAAAPETPPKTLSKPPLPAPTTPPTEPAQEIVEQTEQEGVSTSVKELLGSEPKPDLSP